jgi:hypothetical protein
VKLLSALRLAYVNLASNMAKTTTVLTAVSAAVVLHGTAVAVAVATQAVPVVATETVLAAAAVASTQVIFLPCKQACVKEMAFFA